MRAAHNGPPRLRIYAARTEAEKAFGNGDVYIEKLIINPHHIEFQIMSDQHGHIVHLGERDCSIQRRNQKVIEECPSPLISPGLRKKMGHAAVKLAESVGYQNAGTMEFLVDNEGHYYFIEMNTRIQVEHTNRGSYGCDLVRTDFDRGGRTALAPCGERHRAAARLPMPINAEDPEKNFNRPRPDSVLLARAPRWCGSTSHATPGIVRSALLRIHDCEVDHGGGHPRFRDRSHAPGIG